jgi:hypothetical protein
MAYSPVGRLDTNGGGQAPQLLGFLVASIEPVAAAMHGVRMHKQMIKNV